MRRSIADGVKSLHRPELQPPPVRKRDLIAYAVLAGGFVLIVLGIWEVGGLFNLALGLVTFWVGATAILVEDGRRYRHEIEEFGRIVDGL